MTDYVVGPDYRAETDELPDGYTVRALPSGQFAVYCGVGAQLVRPTQGSFERAVEQAWAHAEGRPMVSSESDDPDSQAANKNPAAAVTDEDSEDDVEAEIAKRRAELADTKWETVREVCEAYDIKYRNKTQAINDIIDVEYPVDDPDDD